MKKSIKKLAVKAIILTASISAIESALKSPVVINEMALLQMQADNASYLAWDWYTPAVRLALTIAAILMVCSVVKDIQKIIKSEKENNNV